MDKQTERDWMSLRDIQVSALLIRQYASHLDAEALAENKMIQDAVIRRFEIIGEAAARTSESFRLQFPALPWQVMKAMRNLLIHEYDSVDTDILWKTLADDLPQLIQQTTLILEAFFPPQDRSQNIDP